jgi:hypothetical protein
MLPDVPPAPAAGPVVDNLGHLTKDLAAQRAHLHEVHRLEQKLVHGQFQQHMKLQTTQGRQEAVQVRRGRFVVVVAAFAFFLDLSRMNSCESIYQECFTNAASAVPVS